MTIGVLVLLFAHFFSDFIIIPDKVAENKWHSEKALTYHVLLYMTGLFLMCWFMLSPPVDELPYYMGWVFVNGIAHWFTDYVTSKDRKVYWDEKDYRMYFITFGIDQLLHYVVLVFTYSLLIHLVL